MSVQHHHEYKLQYFKQPCESLVWALRCFLPTPGGMRWSQEREWSKAIINYSLSSQFCSVYSRLCIWCTAGMQKKETHFNLWAPCFCLQGQVKQLCLHLLDAVGSSSFSQASMQPEVIYRSTWLHRKYKVTSFQQKLRCKRGSRKSI